jgi:hypothetical protein
MTWMCDNNGQFSWTASKTREHISIVVFGGINYYSFWIPHVTQTVDIQPSKRTSPPEMVMRSDGRDSYPERRKT